MNILMLNYEFPPIGGGASPVSYDIGRGLAEKGHKVTVVTMAFQDLPVHEEVDGMEVYRVKCWRTQKMVCHPWEQATYILSAISFIKHHLDMKQFDVCLNHFIIPTGVVAWWVNRKYKMPYVITSHGSDVIGHNNKRFKALYALVKKPWAAIVRAAYSVVAPSKYLLNLMEKTENSGNYIFIPNGIDLEAFARTENKKKKMLIMCRLQETKNVDSIIKALAKIELGDWQIDIVGDGPEKEGLNRLAQECNLADKVCFRGWVTNKSEEHMRYLQETSIYLSASRVENCPTAILEAVSCGAHVLLSDIPAHRQMMGDIDSNVFFELDDVEMLSKKIFAMMLKAENGEMLGNQYDISRFDWEKSMEKYERLLLEAKRK